MQRTLLSIIIILLSLSSFGQFYSSGQDPFRIKWDQIRTKNFRIIYPQDNKKQAQEYANILETSRPYICKSLNFFPKPIPVILHDYSSTSNAFVAWAPKRMELYNIPGQNSYAQKWKYQMALHEYRHVVQINKINQGMTRVLSWFFGQQITAGILGLYIPFWFLEGDAICSETALSSSGRGREASFEMILRAQLLEKGIYSYDKAIYGSFKDRVPNSYELGYFLSAMGRKNYGDTLWDHTLNSVARRPYMVTPFSRGIRDITGYKRVPYYRNTLEELNTQWSKQLKETKVSAYDTLNRMARNFTDYTFVFKGENNVLALKSNRIDISKFISIDSAGIEKEIFTPGFIYSNFISYNAGLLCWAEKVPDVRWKNQEFTAVKVFNIENRKLQTIYHKSRYFAPAISTDGKKIAVVEVNPASEYFLTILDTQTGDIINSISFPNNEFIMNPSWAADNKNIAFILLGEDGKSMVELNTLNQKIKTLIPPSFTEYYYPVYYRNFILFEGAYSGISNIYALDTNSLSIYQVTSVNFGATYPSVDIENDILLFSNYTSDGYQAAQVILNPGKWIPIEKVEDHSIRLYEAMVKQDGFNIDTARIQDSSYSTQRYRRTSNLFNFHSWGPISINASSYEVNPGFSVMSQNLLSSSILEAGYAYNLNEELGKIYASYSYQGFYPMIDINVDYGKRRGNYSRNGQKFDYLWDESNISAGLRLPLSFTRSKYYKGIQPSVSLTQTFREMDASSKVRFFKDDITTFSSGLYMYHNLKKSTRDIYPNWGQSLDIQYKYTPFDARMSSVFAVQANLFFPGILRNHGIYLYAGWQEQKFGYYEYSSIVHYPRGYTKQFSSKLYSGSVNYTLPLIYPDWNIGPVIYIQRIRSTLFWDHAYGEQINSNKTYNSVGIDLMGDTHIFRFIAPIEIGLRYIYFPDRHSGTFQFLFGINFDSFYLGQRN